MCFLFATDAKEQTLYEKMVEGKLLLWMGARHQKTPDPSYQNRGMLARPPSPVERSTTTSEREYRGYKKIMQDDVTLLSEVGYNYSPGTAGVV